MSIENIVAILWVSLIGILAIGIFYMLLKAEMPDEDLEHCTKEELTSDF